MFYKAEIGTKAYEIYGSGLISADTVANKECFDAILRRDIDIAEPEDIAEAMREYAEYDLIEALCEMAGLSEKLESIPDVKLWDVVYEAADILGVKI